MLEWIIFLLLIFVIVNVYPSDATLNERVRKESELQTNFTTFPIGSIVVLIDKKNGGIRYGLVIDQRVDTRGRIPIIRELKYENTIDNRGEIVNTVISNRSNVSDPNNLTKKNIRLRLEHKLKAVMWYSRMELIDEYVLPYSKELVDVLHNVDSKMDRVHMFDLETSVS